MAEFLAALAVTVPLIAVIGALGWYIYNILRHRRKSIDDKEREARQHQYDLLGILEQNFDVLQRLNELALHSNENLVAAAKSVNFNDNTNPDDLRIIFFSYLRINRMFRLYEYNRLKFLDNYEFHRVFDAYIPAISQIVPMIDDLKLRGYPDDFADFLNERVKNGSDREAPEYEFSLEKARNKAAGVQI